MTHIDAYKEVQGWLDDREARALQLIARDARVVEVGCWKAKSSIAMAATARSILSIDHFRGDSYAGAAFTLPEAVENIRKHDTNNKISVLVQDFFSIEDGLMKDVILNADVLYYDGDHSQDSVTKFVEFVSDYDTMPIIAFHDYESSPVYQNGKDVFDSFVEDLIEYDYEPDCLVVVHRLAIIVPPHFSLQIKPPLLELIHD